MRRVFGFPLVFSLALPWLAHAARIDPQKIHTSEEHRFRLEVVSDGLAHPWGLVFLPDGRLLVTEREGRLNLVDVKTGKRTVVAGTPEVVVHGQGGMLDVALHPKFSDNHWVYLSYVAKGEGGFGTHVGRGKLRGDRLEDFEVIFRATPFTDTGHHFGSRLVFDRAGQLFVSLGERNQRERAQDLRDHNGKLIRINDDGSIPKDNPFVGRDDALPDIYSLGHRNIQGLTLHPETGRLWLHEHGPKGGDEINLPEPGKNYGWPVITYGREYWGPKIGPTHKAGYEQPIHHWTPSIAPSGMEFYTGDAFPRWRGDLFVGALVQTHLARLRFQGTDLVDEERLLDDAGLRIRAVRQGPDGLLYLLVDEDSAPLLRMVPTDPPEKAAR